MFKFSIGQRPEHKYGDTYYPCPYCMGQSVFVGGGGRCWDCGQIYNVVKGTKENPRPMESWGYLAAALIAGIILGRGTR